MTSHFDNLMTVYSVARESKNPDLISVANWLADICIQQADRKKDSWNFYIWKEKWGDLHDEGIEQKYHYLNSCHDFLDHGEFHLRVFDNTTIELISIMVDAFEGKEVYRVDRILRAFPGLGNKLKLLGYHPLDKKKSMWKKEGV